MPIGSSVCVDLLFELCETSDDGIENGWLAFKHAIGDHLFVVGSKRFEEGVPGSKRRPPERQAPYLA